jgi:serine/threonine-protein phosphatase 6 regulatory ankyrin repeat subunit A/serine/threonine-protein phosphatase 6 regulatory ankyrin repeat subunit B
MLMRASNTGRIDILELCLRSGLHIDMKADDGFSALHCAARMNQVETLKYLLRCGADVNIYSDNGNSSLPTHEAVHGRSLECFVILLQAKATTKSLDGSFKDVINGITSTGDARFIQCFIANRPFDLDVRSIINATALTAAGSGQSSIISSLISSHPNEVQVATNSHQSPLYLAAKRGHATIVESLLNFFESREYDSKTVSSLKKLSLRPAAKRGHAGVVRTILSRRTTPVINLREAALLAIENGQLGIVRLLATEAKEYGHTFDVDENLRMAVKCNDKEIVALLTSLQPFDMDVVDNPILYSALDGRQWASLEALLQSDNGNVNVKRDGFTALHMAANNGNILVLKPLLQHKDIDINLSHEHSMYLFEHFGDTALDLAIEHEHTEATALLLNHPKLDLQKSLLGGTTLHLAAGTVSLKILHVLLHHSKISVNAKAEDGDTVLHRMLRRDPSSYLPNNTLPHEVIEVLLLYKDIDIHIGDRYGYNALELAQMLGHWSALKLLLVHEGPTLPLHIWSSDPLVLQVLYEYGSLCPWEQQANQPNIVAQILHESVAADIISANAITWDGKTLLHFAVEQHDSYFLEALLTNKDLDPNHKREYYDYGGLVGKQTPLGLARLKNYTVLIDLFLANDTLYT